MSPYIEYSSGELTIRWSNFIAKLSKQFASLLANRRVLCKDKLYAKIHFKDSQSNMLIEIYW